MMENKISIDKCLKGIDLCIVNAKRLYKDGLLLEKNQSTTSTFIYAIAIEEISKAHLLGQITIFLLENKVINWNNFWGLFRSHVFKQTGIFEMVKIGQNLLLENYEELKRKKLSGLPPNINIIKQNISKIDETIQKIKNKKLENIKWQHLYVDYINDQWLLPSEQNKTDVFIKENVESYILDVIKMRNQISKEIAEQK